MFVLYQMQKAVSQSDDPYMALLLLVAFVVCLGFLIWAIWAGRK